MTRFSPLRSTLLTAAAALCLSAASTHAATIPVGSGVDTANVIFNFSDGFEVDYAVHYGATPSDTLTGYAATIAADNGDPNLTTTFQAYDFGSGPSYFLNAVTYGSHTGGGTAYNPAFPENYWHEYVNYGSGYVFGNGASSDVLANGNTIGWVFGSAASPVPEPASAGLLLAGGAVMGLRRRRRLVSHRA